MKLYNIRSFRTKIKEAFDNAKAEEDVCILRDGVVYKLYLANNQDKERFFNEGISSY